MIFNPFISAHSTDVSSKSSAQISVGASDSRVSNIINMSKLIKEIFRNFFSYWVFILLYNIGVRSK